MQSLERVWIPLAIPEQALHINNAVTARIMIKSIRKVMGSPVI